MKEIKLGGALVEYTVRSSVKRHIVPLEDMRYADREGPWQEWSDASGAFKIVARYLRRNTTHATLLTESGKELSVPIDKLARPLRTRLLETPVVAQRPKRVPLGNAGLIGDLADAVAGSRPSRLGCKPQV